MPGELRTGPAGEAEIRVARQLISGLHSLANSLSIADPIPGPIEKDIAATHVAIKSAIGSVMLLEDRLVQRGQKHVSIKFVSDQLHRAVKVLAKTDSFRNVGRVVAYSATPVGPDAPDLDSPPGGMNLLQAAGSLRNFIRSQLEAQLVSGPTALDGVLSPIEYTWNDARITVSPTSANALVFPFPSSERDHAQRLEACLMQAQDLASDLSGRRWQVREDYAIELSRYANRLPTTPDTGNILLADAAARNLREMFAAEQDFLPAPFAARLKTVLQQHIALRPFYPEVNSFYEAVKSGHISEPLPLDAVEHFVDAVRAQTPAIFHPSVVGAIDDTAAASREIAILPEVVTSDNGVISPPVDPLGYLDNSKAHDFQVAGAVNRLWKVFCAGETVNKAAAAWLAAYQALSPSVAQILDWLHRFLGR